MDHCQNLGDMLNQVRYRHDSIVIKRDGKPVAELVDTRLFERIQAGSAGIQEEQVLAEINATVTASHAELVEPQVVRDSDLSDRNDLPVLGRAWWSLNRFPVGRIA